MKKVDIDDRIIVPKLDKRSTAKWISTKNFLPRNPGKHCCIVEREMILGNMRRNGRTYGSRYEVCFFNDLMEAWQDSTLEVVNVTHWLPIPRIPKELRLKYNE